MVSAKAWARLVMGENLFARNARVEGGNLMRARWQRSCLWAVALLVLAGSCHAQSTSATPDQEYQKLIKVDQNIAPLGEHPFGENINPYDGSLSFNVTDVTLRGNGPTITIGRSFQAFEWVPQTSAGPQLPLGSWELDVPRIETLVGTTGLPTTAVWQTGLGGTTPTAGTTNRCTTFNEPPGIASTLSDGGWVPDEWWFGYNLLVPGEGKQQLMPRYSANTLSPSISGLSFNIVTKNNWMVTCGVTASDGGEGFLAIAPDGTRYTFAHLLYRPYFPIVGAGGALPPDGTHIATSSTSSAQSAVAAKSTVTTKAVTPMVAGPGGLGVLYREDAFMYVTQIQDRFGNTLTYNYDPTTGYLSSITASDGREVDVTYVSGSYLIQTITAKATNVASRTWTYSYTNGELTGVQLPDGSAWAYQLGSGQENLYFRNSNCSLNLMPQVGDFTTPTTPGTLSGTTFATITAPSGLTGTFGVALKLSGRSYTPQWCYGDLNGSHPISLYPEWYVQDAITSEVLSGPGMPTQTWTYSYSPANPSFASDACATSGTCATTVYTDVTDPNGNDTRYTYSNRFDATEGQLLRADTYSGAYGGTLVRSVVNTYANASGGPWPSVYGIDLVYRGNYFQSEQLAPLSQRTTTQDGQNYTWQAMAFNAYAQPTDVKRYNDIAGQSSIEETTAYLNDTNLWVLGLPQTATNVTTGETESSNSYNGQDLLQSRARFGEFMMSYTYNSAGQLASFTDGNNHTTNLSNYYRGIPQSISYPDSTSQTLVVDDLGEISSVTDQAGFTTQYNYDPIGRISFIIYPKDGSAAWNADFFNYKFVTTAERGIAAGHWDRITTNGNGDETTYFDALLRPILHDTALSGLLNTDVSTATTYDWTGAVTFNSYPVSGTPDISTITTGVHHVHDALGRETQRQEDSELGPLTTSTAYLSGAGKQVTDPKGNVTTAYYQVFDEPSYKDPIQVNAPGGVSQSIVRDIYGNPASITQSGAYGSENDSVSKMLMYDAYHRLCRMTEPESGSEVMAYDAANNLAWSAQGQIITDGTCGQGDVSSAAQTTRTYDAMNRVLTITPPTGTQQTTYTYDPRGNVATATSGIGSQGFTYNSRNMLATEVLSVPGHAWAMAYSYDDWGHLAAIGYPSYNGSSEGVAYKPDERGRATQVGGYASGITYFPNNQVAGFNYGNGASYVAQQNSRQLLNNFSYGVGSALNLSEDFVYDANGNITNVNDLVNNARTKSFAYDALNRLTNATANGLYGTETYTYDALNNLRSRLTGGNTLTLNYNANNQLTSVSEGANTITVYGYDPQGNRNSLSSGGTTTNYTFDAEDQLLQVSGVGGYAYDAKGRRIAKTAANGGVTAYYFYDHGGQLMYEFDPASATGTNYIYLGTKLIAKHVMPQPGSPSSVSLSSYVNTGTFTVSWTVVAGATSYNVSNGVQTTAVNGGNATSLSVTGLAAGQYTYQVQACEGGVCGPWTSAPSLQVLPTIPVITVPSGIVNGTYLVSWTASAGNSVVYTLQESFNGGAWNTVASTLATSVSRPGTTSGSYTYRVEAALNGGNAAGWSTTSNAVTVNTNYGVTPTPLPTFSVPSTNNTGTQTINWTASSPVTTYTLQKNSTSGTPVWVTVYSGSNTSTVLSNLGNGSYTFQLDACNATGGATVCTTWVSAGPMVVTLPPASAPSLSTPSGVVNFSPYTVSWTSVATATTYNLQQQVNGGSWSTIQATSATSWSASGEGNGTYGYRVQACNGNQCGPWSGTNTVTVNYPPSSAPSLSGGGSSTGSYSLSWTAVATATSYTLMQSTNGGSSWTAVQSNGATSWSVSGQSAGSYIYMVNACDAGGCSGWSNQITETVSLVPATPTVTVKQSSTGKFIFATVTWAAVPNATYYVVREVNGATDTQVYSGTNTSWSGSYAYGALRSFNVEACNSAGCSPWSND